MLHWPRMQVPPYRLPLIPQYKSRDFKKASRLWKPVVESLLFRESRFKKGLQDVWARYVPREGLGNGKFGWRPKLYVCLGASSYWPVVMRLINKFRDSRLPWKFFMAPSGYERPDKIVFYFDSGAQLKSFIKILRPLLPKNGFHELRHAASTARMGMEAGDRRGLYVGIDPPLGGGQSWRMYRCMCLAWADMNRRQLEKLPGGTKRWLERMNLSAEHEGPRTLAPASTDTAYVRRFWRMII